MTPPPPPSRPPPPPPPPDQHYYAPPETPLHPPDSPYPWQPGWPKVIGIISIVVAAWGIYTSGGMILMGNQMTSLSGQQFEKLGFSSDMLAKLQRYTLINGTGCLALGALLLAGGIVLLRRRRVSRGLMMLWAVLRIGLAAATVPLMIDYTRAMVDGMVHAMPASTPAPAGDPSTPSTVPASPGAPSEEAIRYAASVGSVVTAAMGIVMACALPVFVLVWFNLRKVREYTATLP